MRFSPVGICLAHLQMFGVRRFVVMSDATEALITCPIYLVCRYDRWPRKQQGMLVMPHQTLGSQAISVMSRHWSRMAGCCGQTRLIYIHKSALTWLLILTDGCWVYCLFVYVPAWCCLCQYPLLLPQKKWFNEIVFAYFSICNTT